MPSSATPQGTVAEGFEPVREAFAAVLSEERDDHAAQLAAYVSGRQVVDLWAGPEMSGDSLIGVFSSTKGAAHLTVALLVQDGTLDLDTEVRHIWPEFAANGKSGITLRDLLSHRAGLIGTDGGFSPEELADDRAIAERLATQAPYWRPGTAFGYHALVIGALTGEVVRRATGQSMQEVYEARIRAPYSIDFYMGLPASEEARFLHTLPMDPTSEQQAQLDAAATGPESLTGIAYNRNHHPRPTNLETLPNSRAMRALGPASVGGIATASGLARMYAAAISGVDGRAPLLTPETAAEFAQIHSIGFDLVDREHNAFGLGFNATAGIYPFLSARSFGHGGAAGSQAFADPLSGLAFGYTRRRMSFYGGRTPEAKHLAEVIHSIATSQQS